jgi:hypothetical protein
MLQHQPVLERKIVTNKQYDELLSKANHLDKKQNISKKIKLNQKIVHLVTQTKLGRIKKIIFAGKI